MAHSVANRKARYQTNYGAPALESVWRPVYRSDVTDVLRRESMSAASDSQNVLFVCFLRFYDLLLLAFVYKHKHVYGENFEIMLMAEQ